MSIKFPTFTDTYCKIFTVCGKIKNKKKVLDESAKTQLKKSMAVFYETDQGDGFLSIFSGKKEEHLHIDCALKKFFPKGQVPKITSEKNQVENILENFIDSTINVRTQGFFVFPFEELPIHGLIRSLSFEEKISDIKVKLIGGELLIEGAPINNIEWKINKDKSEVNALIISEIPELITIDDEYLNRLISSLENAAKNLILGEATNEH